MNLQERENRLAWYGQQGSREWEWQGQEDERVVNRLDGVGGSDVKTTLYDLVYDISSLSSHTPKRFFERENRCTLDMSPPCLQLRVHSN